ncbi:MAG: DNA cytosine methyltransferase [Verrucomicrobia bacterium]|nr:DNA cytosine methyltransferase [Verrucomicrobiota bacterium]
MPRPVIDLFAGPGGLGEGFSALRPGGDPAFKIRLSIEKDPLAHQTLQLRAFFRQFPDKKAPDAYYDYLAGLIPREDLFKQYPAEAKKADQEAWHAELGGEKFPPDLIDARIRDALGTRVNWVLIGGPPCQAYSLVGRSRVIGREGLAKYEADPRHELYRHYLRIIAVHQPPVFVMENVKGLLSAKVQEQHMFERIRSDLENPLDAVFGPARRRETLRYRLVSLVVRNGDLLGRCEPEDFVVRAEDYGIPQARHRIILLGILAENERQTGLLKTQTRVPIEDVISDLPRLRSGLSKEPDNPQAWRDAVLEIADSAWLHGPRVDDALRREVRTLLREVDASLDRGGIFVRPGRRVIRAHRNWFQDERLDAVCNHETRSHIRPDLHRYFFVSAFARIHNRSPLLEDFPPQLLPKHENVAEALEDTKFNDRFRVQCAGRPSTTVTSHISKDGHYFIHYDPTQCRSLTVREAARLQTFPDNYFFEGPRTQQYHQVGNAVPPLLARQIAEIVYRIFN